VDLPGKVDQFPKNAIAIGEFLPSSFGDRKLIIPRGDLQHRRRTVWLEYLWAIKSIALHLSRGERSVLAASIAILTGKCLYDWFE
jgi:hypothetical protein